MKHTEHAHCDAVKERAKMRKYPFILLLSLLWLIDAQSVPGQNLLTFEKVIKDGQGAIDGLNGASGLKISLDGKYVYATGNIDDAIAVFSRSASDGALTFVETWKDNTTGVDGLNGARGLAISPDDKHIYVAGESDDAIAVFSRNATSGLLTFVQTKKDNLGGVDGLDGVAGVTVSPDGKHVYAVSALEKAIVVFTRDAVTGTLEFVEKHVDGQSGVDGLDGAVAVTVSGNGRHVYTTGNIDDAIAVFSRNSATGALAFVERKQDGTGGVTGLDGVSSATLSSDDKYLYAAGTFDGAIAVFSRNDSTGALTFVEAHFDNLGGVNGLGGAVSTRLSPDGRHLYVAGSFDDAVAVFSRNDSTGTLTFAGAIFEGQDGAQGLDLTATVEISPDGQHVYATGNNDDAVVVFTRNTVNGTLTYEQTLVDAQGGVTGLFDIRSIAVSPDGRSIYVANNAENGLAIFHRDALTDEPVFVEEIEDNQNGVDGLNGAFSALVSPEGTHVYVAGSVDDGVAVFSRNSATGALTFVEAKFDGVGGINGLDGAADMKMSPDSLFLYVAGRDEDAIAVFSRNKSTGKLTFVEFQQEGVGGVTGLDGVISLAVTPNGKHVYATGYQGNTIAVFSRNRTTGRLTFVAFYEDHQGGLADLFAPTSVVVSPDNRFVYVTADFDDAVSAFSRNDTTGTLTFIEVKHDNTGGVDGLSGATASAVSADGQYLYVASEFESALAVFKRNTATGRLTFLETHKDGKGSIDGLASVEAVTAVGDRLYAAGDIGDGLAIFRVNDLAPASPESLKTASDERRVTLTWKANTEVDMAQYRIYRHTVRDSIAASAVFTVSHPDTAVTDTTVSNGVVYHYWISAMDNGNNESALSPGTLATPADAPPARPLRLTATAGFRKVELNWPRSAEPDLSHYVLYRNTVSSFTPTISDTIATIPAPDTSFTDTKVSNGVTYYYRVSAVDTLGMESGVSPETSAQPSGPTAVTLVSIAAEETFGMVHLSWQTASERNHAGFQLLRGPSAQGPFQTINATLIQPWKPGHYLFIDKEVEINRVYTYLLQSVATDGQVETVHTLVVTVQPPRTFELAQNYPNPFNPETTIRYALAGPSHVTVTVYNMAGQTIRTLVEQHQAIGFYTVRWDGRNSYGEPVASGVYLYRIQAGDFSSVRKMLLIK